MHLRRRGTQHAVKHALLVRIVEPSAKAQRDERSCLRQQHQTGFARYRAHSRKSNGPASYLTALI